MKAFFRHNTYRYLGCKALACKLIYYSAAIRFCISSYPLISSSDNEGTNLSMASSKSE